MRRAVRTAPVGFALLITLMVFVTWRDVYNLFWTR